jgi:hypothetical protein
MIGWFVLGVFILIAAFYALRAFVNADPKTLAKGLRHGGVGILGLGAGYMALSGRFGPAIALGIGALWLAGRWPWGIPGFGHIRFPAGWRPVGSGGASEPDPEAEVETAWLRMSLDRDSNEMSGLILRGPQKGRRLEELSFAELIDLLAECRIDDAHSAALLEAYLDRTEPEDWRERAARPGGAESDTRGPAARRPAGRMSADEARAVLGIGPSATPEEIRAAHHRLMKKLHPDQGGSNRLASEVNEAKDVLLGE